MKTVGKGFRLKCVGVLSLMYGVGLRVPGFCLRTSGLGFVDLGNTYDVGCVVSDFKFQASGSKESPPKQTLSPKPIKALKP